MHEFPNYVARSKCGTNNLLLNFFFNQVMQREAFDQIRVKLYESTSRGKAALARNLSLRPHLEEENLDKPQF